jgi:hypothetical protein
MPRRTTFAGLSLLVLLSISLSCGRNDPPVSARRVDVSVKNNVLKVKDLDGSTTLYCECPCSVSFDKDPVTYSC